VFANIQILVVMVCKNDLLLVITELQVCHVFVDFHRRFIGSACLFSLLSRLLELFDFLRGLLWLASEVSLVDLATEDRSL
jgi:hypothetical protein